MRLVHNESGQLGMVICSLFTFFFFFAFRYLVQLYAFFASMIPPLRFSDFLWVLLLVTCFWEATICETNFCITMGILIYTSCKVSIGRWNGWGKTVL